MTPKKTLNPVLKKSLRTALFDEVSTLVLLTVFLVTVSAFYLVRHEFRQKTLLELDQVVSQKRDLLGTVVDQEHRQLALIANGTVQPGAAVSQLVGFESLYRVSGDSVRLVSGKPQPSDTVSRILAENAASRVFTPLFLRNAWNLYLIAASGPQNTSFVGVFDASPLLQSILDVPHIGDTADIMLSTRQGSDLIALRGSTPLHPVSALFMGSAETPALAEAPLRQSVSGHEGAVQSTDYTGIPILAAYRSWLMPGWGIVAQIDLSEVDAPVRHLALAMLAIGVALSILMAIVAFVSSRRITAPIFSLAAKMQRLETRQWAFSRSIFTGDEIEVLDAVAFDLTRRLRDSHRHLESIVRERTKALTAQTLQDQTIFKNMEFGLMVTDATGKILLLNIPGQSLTGWTEKKAIGQPFSHVLSLVDKDGQPVKNGRHPISQVLKTGKKFTAAPDPNLSLMLKTGKTLPIHLRITPILHGKHCRGTVALFRDYTEDRRIDQMKSEFISLASHQLRTPLSSMRWYLEMLSGGDGGTLSEQQKEYVRQVSTSNYRMVRLVDALLSVSRMELGNLKMNIQSVNILAVVKKVVESIPPGLLSKPLHVNYSFPDKELFVIRTDESMLQLIVENLIVNSVKYAKANTPAIDISLHRKKDGSVILTVSDKGIGIPSAEQKHIFQKLYRATNAKESDTDGSGLGLYISRLTAQSIGGSLTFHSQEGHGSRFVLTLRAM